MKNATRTGQAAQRTREAARVGRAFAQLTAQPAAHLGAGVAEEIESDLQRGGAGVGRRIGTAFLSQPFGKMAARLRSDDGAAVAMAEALATIRGSAKAHRAVADLLDMAEARLVLALGRVVKDIEARKPGGRRAAA